MLGNLFTGYFGILLENMAVPIALFLDETQARDYAQREYGDKAVVKKFPAFSQWLEVLNQC